MQRVCIITGASSGIGREIAKIASKKGDIVYNLSRKPCDLEGVKNAFCDVTEPETIVSALKTVMDTEGRIDCLINNAGIGISGPAELEPDQDVDKIIDVNFRGAIDVVKKTIPYLKTSKGTIVNIGSAGGEFALPFQAYYSATKLGLQAFSIALKNELRPLGVRVACALPGDTKTSFTKNRIKTEVADSEYGERVKRSVSKMEHDEQNGLDPVKVAHSIYKLSIAKNPPATRTIGVQYKILRFIKRLVPERLLVFILYRMYGK